MNFRVRMVWAMVLALIAGLSSYSYLTRLQQEVPVVIATADIPARTIIQPDMVQVVHIAVKARDAVLSDAISDPAQVIGALAALDIPKGQAFRNDPRWLIRDADAVQAVKDGRLSYFLPKETRAITITVDNQGLVAGRIKADDLVDVMFSSKDDNTGGVYTAMILQHVRVISVDSDGKGAGGQNLVTLLVSPEQALDLTLAKRRGTIDLALSPRFPETVNLPAATPLKFPKMGQTQ